MIRRWFMRRFVTGYSYRIIDIQEADDTIVLRIEKTRA